MDNILINLDDGIRLGGSELPSISEQSDIISQSDTLVGPPGPQGPQGPVGPAGPTGPQGPQGPQGAAGPQGPAGRDGVDGTDGVDGQDGAAATITVGSVTTVDYEYPATVTNSGTSSAAVLNFNIPRGVPGETGATGATGPQGPAGPQGDTGPAGPTGPQGPAGADGADGAAATITVGSTTTGAAGTNASVTNSGTSSAAVLNFTIPRGDTGTVDVSTTKVTTTPLWTGNIYSAGSYADLSEPMQAGQVYIITVKGLSGTYIMEFSFTMRYNALQFAYYDGSTVARWRLNINSSNNRITIDGGSLNMGTNTAILRVDKVILTQ